MNPSTPGVELDAATLLGIELDGIRLIEASAGTGKTYTLANLYLRHILEGRQPREILVVTYTNAATDELRNRIQQRLYETQRLFRGPSGCEDEFLSLLLEQYQALGDDDQDLQQKRLLLALRAMDEASISTIHAFCQRSLMDFALTGNQFFSSNLLTDDDPLWQQAIKDWWRKNTYNLDPGGWNLFSNHADNLDQLLSKQRLLRAKPSAVLLSAGDQSLQTLFNELKKFTDAMQDLQKDWHRCKVEVSQILTQTTALLHSNTKYHPDKMGAYLEEMEVFFTSETPFKLPKTLHYLSASTLRNKTRKSTTDPGLNHPFFRLVDELLQLHKESMPILAQIKSRALLEAHRYASQAVLEIKKRARSLAYDDLLTQLLRALAAPSGDSLGDALRQRYPVAMIDEFQDTDATQYEIFERIYFSAKSISLSLIGDPKQAIYSFRGGDIFTYMRARHTPGIKIYSLLTNWRSHPGIVAAVNAIFQRRPDPFIYGDSIEFVAASAAAVNQHRFLRRGDQEASALSLWHLSELTTAGATSQDYLLEPVNRAIAEEILRLLEAGKASISGNPVSGGDIAILVRSAYQGQQLSKTLNSRGIRSVTIGREKVFDSDEAGGLLELLRAILHQSSQTIARCSLASDLFHFDYQAIAAIGDDDLAWQKWNEKLYDLRQRWSRSGFIAMFQQLLQCFQISKRLARRDNAERRLTNLLHLGELLHQQAAQRAGMESLLGWLQAQMEDNNNEAAELRLESDEALVKIVTIHKSKGLQYPVVFVPFLWSCTPIGKNRPLSFHDDQFNAFIDLGSDAFDNNRFAAEKERLAEDIRLLYVALTRAQSKAYLVWGQATSAAQTALAYLLHSAQTPVQLEHELPQGFPAEMNFVADLQTLSQASGTRIETLALPSTITTSTPAVDESRSELLEPVEATSRRTSEWRINSFTGLTRDVHQVAHRGENRSQGDAILDFPAGSHVGLLIHSLLEHLDFQQDIPRQCRVLVPRFAGRYGLGSDSYQILLQQWIELILDTVLDSDSLKLGSLANTNRLNELSFDFAFDHLDISRLNSVLQTTSDTRLEPLTAKSFAGLITGVIDLVFVHQGKYYLADYKSNHLGSSLQDYRPDRLKQAMVDRRYDLQSLIYTIALHRYLGRRIPDYRYEQHFGGCFYLFLRAMRPQSGPDRGVYFERFAVETIETLETTVFHNGKTAFIE